MSPNNGRKNIYSRSDHRINKKKFTSNTALNKKILTSILLTFFSVIIGFVGWAFVHTYNTLDNINHQPIQDQNEKNSENSDADYVPGSSKDSKVLNVALFGVDQHEETDVHSRSDSIMVVSLDNRRKKIKLTSIMRDIYLKIPGQGSNRINAAVALGGPALAIKTIEQNFNIKIDRFCTVNFSGFKDIIDIIGGLDIELTKEEAHHINRLLIELDDALKKGGLQPFKSSLIEEKSGTHHLNGAQSLQYARSRKVATAEGMSDDYARTFRQRKVISLVIAKLKKSSLTQILSVIEKAGPYINTNLKKDEIITLGRNSLKCLQYEINEFRLPEDGNFEVQNINGASVLVIKNMDQAKYDLAKFIYEDSIKGTYKPKVKSQYSNNINKSSDKNSISNSDSNNGISNSGNNNTNVKTPINKNSSRQKNIPSFKSKMKEGLFV